MILTIEFNNRQEFQEKIVELFLLASEDSQDKLNEMLTLRVTPEQLETPHKKETRKKTPKVEEDKDQATAESDATDSDQEARAERLITSMDELRQAFTKKNSAANRPKLKAILTDLGVSKITQLPEDKWDQAFTMLEAI